MGRRRNSQNEDMPFGVYRSGKRFKAIRYVDGKLKHVGTYDTPEEAQYNWILEENKGHHWQGMKTGPYFGFTYMITHKPTQKRYIGKKQFFLWDGPVGGYKCTDMTDEWWDEKAWKPNAWELYTGSQNDLNKEIKDGEPIFNYSFEVLDMCRTRLDLHLSELAHMLAHDVLEAVDDEGHYLFYNKNIAGLEFRAPFRKCDVKEKRLADEEAMRNYYLKPDICGRCMEAIPYGSDCNCYEGDSSLETLVGGFKDVR